MRASESPGKAPEAGFETHHARPVLGICVAMGFTTLLDQTIFGLALPRLRDSLHASPDELQLIVSVYSIAFGIALVPAGRLGDLIGRRLLFLVGLVMFSGFSLVGGLADTAQVLIVARLLQGVGAGMINTQVLGLIQDLFRGDSQARALGRYASAGGLAGLAGPVLGGLILALTPAEVGWRLMFLVNVPFGVVIFYLALRHLPHGRASTGRFSVDGMGLVLLSAVTLFSMLATLQQADTLLSARSLLLAAIGAAALFLMWERHYQRRGGSPILGAGLTGSPGYVLGTLVAMFQFAGGTTFGMVTTLFFLDGLKTGPLLFALLSIAPAMGMMVSSARSWRFAARFGRMGVVAAIAAYMAALVLLGAGVLLLPARGILLLYPLLGLLLGASGGLIHAPNQAMALAEVGAGEGRGTAAGFFQLSQRLASSIGMSWGIGLFLDGAKAHGGLLAWRHAFAEALVLILGLLGAALAAALGDWIRRRRIHAMRVGALGGATGLD
ncbi:MFS transporter [Paraburkholderia bannensis]|uniref:MFS transporter n=1 Tax=Paraburkholderia bannensis TaxID=765414 RepID=UPI002AB12A06|nr:MFS transporter [Paraburkholderia bannensis]